MQVMTGRIQQGSGLVLAIFLFVGVPSARGQAVPEPGAPPQGAGDRSGVVDPQTPPKQSILRTLASDEWSIWSSPFRAKSYSSHTVKKYVIPMALLSGVLIATDRKTGDLLPNTEDQTKWSGRVSQIGAAYTLAGFSGATLLVGELIKDQHAKEAGWLSLQAIAHSQAVVFGIKQATNRQRPVTGDGRGGFWAGGDSFPSGHATTTFAVATVFAYEYRHHIAVPITAYTLATAVAASRMSARRHWVSDIVVGGSMGFLIGRFVYKRHHDPTLPGSVVNRASRMMPEFGFGAGGVALAWRW
jgi:hypothetical protein